MALKNPKYDAYRYIGVDPATGPDILIISVPCWNCGVYREMDDNNIVEECPNCGDEETDLSMPDNTNHLAHYTQEREPNADQDSDQDPEVPQVS